MPRSPRPVGTQPPLVRVPRVKAPWEVDGLGDIAALVDVLGGNAVVPAFYDVRAGVTDAGGVASQWADVRGAGFGPALTAAGAARPTWDGSVLTFDGAAHVLGTAASSLFVVSGAYSLVLVAAVPQTVGLAYPAAINDGTEARVLAVQQTAGAGGVIRALMENGINFVEPSSGVAVSATRRVAIASKTATTGASIDVPNAARASLVNAASVAAGDNVLSVGALRSTGTFYAKPVVRAVLCLSKQVSAADVTAIFAWARDNHGAVAA